MTAKYLYKPPIFNTYAEHYFFTVFLKECNFKVKDGSDIRIRLLCMYVTKYHVSNI